MSAAALFALLSGRQAFAQAFHVTPHELLPEQKIVVESNNVPQWKIIWDEARESALEGDFDKAVQSYKSLLVLKSNLQEGRWELTKLLIYLKRWNEAAEHLEFLLGAEPENILYINSLGKVMLEMNQYDRAEDLFSKVYEINSTDQTALAGLVEALSKLGKKDEALPYLEQLSRQDPTNRGVRRYLAFLYYDAGNYEKAKVQLSILARNEDVEPDVLFKTAKTYENLGMEDQAAFYWERMLAREPDNIEAHAYLAKYYEKKGQFDKALSHLQAGLAANPDDPASLVRIAEAYAKVGEYEKSLTYYKRYLEKYPDDLQILRRVETINTAQLEKNQVFRSQGLLFIPEGKEKKEELLNTIHQYETAGRYLDALPLYRKLLELSPEDPDVIAALVSDLLVIGEKEGRLKIVQHLSEIVSDNLAIYRAIASMLQRLEREDELVAILSKILELDPEDNATRQELAIIYLQKGDLEQSRHYFAEIPDSSCMNAECLQFRGLLSEKLNLPQHGLGDYELLLQEQPDRYDIRKRALSLSVKLGLLDRAVYHAGYLQQMVSGKESLELKMLLAELYKITGYFNRAVERYQHIIDETRLQKDEGNNRIRIRSWLGMAESYKETGLFYEAEQTLRSALAIEEDLQPLLTALFQLSLESGNLPKSQIWLQALIHEMEMTPLGRTTQTDTNVKILSFQAEAQAAAGDYHSAFAQLEKAQKLLAKPQGWDDFYDEVSPDFALRLKMAEYSMRAGDTETAENNLISLRYDYGARPEIFVLLEQVYHLTGQEEKARNLKHETEIYADEDSGRQLRLAELFRKYNDPDQQLEMAGKAATVLPDSLAVERMLVDARIARGEYAGALERLQQFQKNYPENTWFLLRKVQVLVKLGNFQDALAASDVILVEDPGRNDILLLKARILWEMNHWKESVAIYESVIAPPVDERLAGKMPEQIAGIESVEQKRSWREIVTFSKGKSLSLAEVVMSPQHAVDFSQAGQEINAIAAGTYALFRWQERFGKELAARQAVIHRDYNHAAYLLENELKEYGSNDFLLYDLAGLYSKLERLNDESRIYSVLEKRNADFPGLTDSIQRNRLKRRPHTYLLYGRTEDDGWDGYKDMKEEIVTGGGWVYQSTDRKWSIDFSRINYASMENPDQRVWGLRTMATYDMKISQSLDLSLGGGLEDLGNGYGNNFLYSAILTGKVADDLRAVLTAKQDVTTDTVASLTREILQKDYKAELLLDLFPRLLLGGYYDFIDYSDSNWTKNYTFWASYIMIPEPTLLKLSYNYDYYDSKEGQKPGVPSDDGFALDDHPYWSPVNYWITKFSFYFKHQLSNDTLARGVPSYYTIEYAVGYDSDDNDYHELKGSFNIELAKRYILSASYGLVDMNVYRNEEALFSLTYRW